MESAEGEEGKYNATHRIYDVRHAKSIEETMQVWWPNMKELQWNRGPAELATYLRNSNSKGMVLGFVSGSTEPVGHVAAVVNENSTGWVALFVVKAGYRQLGLGAALWDRMMEDFRAAQVKIIGLDAVPAQVPTYQRRGFVDSKLGIIKLMTRSLGSSSQAQAPSDSIRSIQEIDPVILAQYERDVTGFYRPELWHSVVHRQDVIGFVALDEESTIDEGSILGLVVVRRAPLGVRLSPLYAESARAAEQLLLAALDGANATFVRQHVEPDHPLHLLDDEAMASQAVAHTEMWTGNTDAEPLFAKYAWTEMSRYHRMWFNGTATPEQSEGGHASTSLYSIFDAATG